MALTGFALAHEHGGAVVEGGAGPLFRWQATRPGVHLKNGVCRLLSPAAPPRGAAAALHCSNATSSWRVTSKHSSESFTAKFERGERGVYDQYGQSYPRVHGTLDDMQRCGEKLSTFVLTVKEMAAAVRRRPSGTATAKVGSPSNLTPMPRSRLVETALI